jgi:hypothetical protein
MATFKFDPRQYKLPPEGIYAAQVVGAKNGRTKGNERDPETYPKIDLILITLPEKRGLFTTLIFGGRGIFTVTRFCVSAGLELPEEEVALSLCTEDCLHRIVYPQVRQEQDDRGTLRARVADLLPRDRALHRNPELESIILPGNVPAPRKVTVAQSSRVQFREIPTLTNASRKGAAAAIVQEHLPF